MSADPKRRRCTASKQQRVTSSVSPRGSNRDPGSTAPGTLTAVVPEQGVQPALLHSRRAAGESHSIRGLMWDELIQGGNQNKRDGEREIERGRERESKPTPCCLTDLSLRRPQGGGAFSKLLTEAATSVMAAQKGPKPALP